ncbi:Protein CBG23163 [Caenorhabditis briggsae]|uniref:Protein CBG23163 n=1 Tax=Caenorhabditis briggsae TaxID=6238 RepID=A8Y4J9_CAEBR|nr:Protein CBG23163 [Caenorhabditis briggsae]CAP39819.2 Protein CBG23163 [Caenorhabditis briggsae]
MNSISNCPPHKYYESATFHQILSYSISLITTPVNFYGVYLTLFKSEKTLKNAKWVMLNSQIWSMISSLMITTFLVPFLISPVVGGHPLGLFTHFGIPVFWQCLIGFGSIAQTGSTMVIVFENQQNHLVTDGIKLNSTLSRRLFAIFNQAIGFLFIIPVLMNVPDQEVAKRNVAKWIVCPPPEFYDMPIFILAEDSYLIRWSVSSMLAVYIFQGGFFIKLSFKTRNMQRKFFITVYVQIFLPFTIVGIPVFFLVFSVATGYHNQCSSVDILISPVTTIQRLTLSLNVEISSESMDWNLFLLISVILTISGLVSNVMLIKLVAFKEIFDKYCKIGIGVISFSVVIYLIAYGIETLVCVLSGTPFRNPVCQEHTIYQLMSFVYTMTAMISYTSQTAFTIERIVSIKIPKFHDSRSFQQIFWIVVVVLIIFSFAMSCFHHSGNKTLDEIYGISTQAFVLSNLPLMIVAKVSSRKMYRADVKTYDLARKHQLFNSYEITSSFLFALIINYLIEAFALLLLGMFKYGNYFFSEDETGKMEFIIQMFWNINHTIFPWSVILFHRGQRSIFKKSKIESNGMTSIDGTRIVSNPTQNDCFEQMKLAWTGPIF